MEGTRIEGTRIEGTRIERRDWWKEAVVYQVYPKSFRDSNGDGVGDIRGITQKLDYLTWLGVNVLWICPVYCSPMADNGYDISDYYHIDPSFGTDKDMEELLEEARRRNIKVLMDLVVNHTSDEHSWFRQALSDPDSRYASYYIFREGKGNEPPDNIRSYFGGSAWERVGDSNRYYFHAFGRKQPDLNWENGQLREEIYRMMNFWLDKGLGGFRVDAIGNIKKNLQESHYPADAPDGRSHAGKWILNQPGIEEYLQEMKERTVSLHNAMTVAEVSVPDDLLPRYIGDNGFFSMVFDFSYTDLDVPPTGEWFLPTGWTVEDLRRNLFRSQEMTQQAGWGAVYLENHDQPRSPDKYIPAEDIGCHSITMLATLFMMLRGTPFIYQGQELGMTNIHMKELSDYDDPATHDQFHRAVAAGMSTEAALEAVGKRSRDNSRTPMQWNGKDRHAGFSDADSTWLKVNPNYEHINVEEEAASEISVLNYYRQLIRLRTESYYRDTVIYGSLKPYEAVPDGVVAYERIGADSRMLVICNFTGKAVEVILPGKEYEIVLCNYNDRKSRGSVEVSYACRAYESVVLIQSGK